MSALLVVGILVFLIVIHELGHFFVAKFFKVKVEEFGVGYPPRALLFGKWGGTEYTLNWIPFGGFVRLLGEHDTVTGDITTQKGSFARAPRMAQALILIAGVAMNALAAWILFASALAVGMPHGLSPGETAPGARLMVRQIIEGSPAKAIGLEVGDVITGIREGDKSAELTPESVVAFVQERGGKELTLSFLHGDLERQETVYPAHAVVPEASSRPALGIGLALVSSAPVPFFDALVQALPVTRDKSAAILGSLWAMIRGAFQGSSILEGVIGPVGLVSVVGSAAEHGAGNVLVLAGFISLNLAVINLIPIPALDGGRIVLLGIEAVLGRSAPRIAVQLTNSFGIGLIVLLMISVTYNDVLRLFS